MTADIVINQVGCARCDGDGHPNIVFHPFTRPIEVDGIKLTHWAMCPTVNEPIVLMSIAAEQIDVGVNAEQDTA